ncbi:Uncharacterised protein [Raoultella terrigena]|uniref:GntR C-terminal domain-containing protein n=3 Tax=Raoultella terrigena TaxID=577 RepID=A0A485BCU1_RAOTE|nr:Uncharacterised protein [Raoultella terrigena]
MMRRLDFEYEARIAQTYEEHAELLEAIERRQEERAVELITLHIKDAHNGASTITLRRLQRIRAKALSCALPLNSSESAVKLARLKPSEFK